MTTLSHTMSVGVDSVLSSRASSETALIGKAEGKPLNSAWSTVRFRRAKTAKAWALLGIPSRVYPIVTHRLFELRARFLDKHEDGPFVSLLFEAPPALAARLALAFPAPPGCESLSVAERGDRILSGRAANSTKALRQALDPADQDIER